MLRSHCSILLISFRLREHLIMLAENHARRKSCSPKIMLAEKVSVPMLSGSSTENTHGSKTALAAAFHPEILTIGSPL